VSIVKKELQSFLYSNFPEQFISAPSQIPFIDWGIARALGINSDMSVVDEKTSD